MKCEKNEISFFYIYLVSFYSLREQGMASSPVPESKPANYLYLEAAKRRFLDTIAVYKPKPKETPEAIHELFLNVQKRQRYRGEYRKHLIYACAYHLEIRNDYEFRKIIATRYGLDFIKFERCLQNIRNFSLAKEGKKDESSSDSDSSDY